MHVLPVGLPCLITGNIDLGSTPRKLDTDKLGVVLNREVSADLDGLRVRVTAPLEGDSDVGEHRAEPKRRNAVKPTRELVDLILTSLFRDGKLNDGPMAVRERHVIYRLELTDVDVRSRTRVIERRKKLLTRYVHLGNAPVPRGGYADFLVGVKEQHLGDTEAASVLVALLGRASDFEELTAQQFGGHTYAVILNGQRTAIV